MAFSLRAIFFSIPLETSMALPSVEARIPVVTRVPRAVGRFSSCLLTGRNLDGNRTLQLPRWFRRRPAHRSDLRRIWQSLWCQLSLCRERSLRAFAATEKGCGLDGNDNLYNREWQLHLGQPQPCLRRDGKPLRQLVPQYLLWRSVGTQTPGQELAGDGPVRLSGRRERSRAGVWNHLRRQGTNVWNRDIGRQQLGYRL